MTTQTLELPEQLDGLQYRRATIEDVEATAKERVIVMRMVPYGVETRLAEGLFESFEPAAFANAAKDPSRVKLFHGHSDRGGQIVGQALEVEDRTDGSWSKLRVSKTAAGDELLTLAEDGVLDEASIEFLPIRQALKIERRGDAVHVRHRRGQLKGVALVPYGQYGRNALVVSVREEREQALEQARHAAIARLRGLNG